ncbi:SDR family NAD(P)-dependent oxidoreductase [Parapedobacter sp. DT-150]|uniref:SDR family NAD(P)-dependent oxidoreductase n=1 Tax=Parapedobacter sp. DT-150 TaxID=3396162 RepID=UPI003F19EC98
MLLKNKQAIVYGAGGSIGSAVAKAFADEGAVVLLAGRTKEPLEAVQVRIRAAGGNAEIAVVDACDGQAIVDQLTGLMEVAGQIDISFNAIGLEDTQNIPLADMALDDFMRPITIAMRSHFLTAKALVPIMSRQGAGVILSITATPGGIGYPQVGGFGPACSAIESFSRDLATEVGPAGIRVVNIRSAGSPDSRPFVEAMRHDPEVASLFISKIAGDTMLKRLPLMDEIARIAVFLASDHASTITGVTIDATCGTTSGLNANTVTIPF